MTLSVLHLFNARLHAAASRTRRLREYILAEFFDFCFRACQVRQRLPRILQPNITFQKARALKNSFSSLTNADEKCFHLILYCTSPPRLRLPISCDPAEQILGTT